MKNTLTISELGKLTGLTTKTIRFYEEIKLIPAAKRAENGYRIYEKQTGDELILIKNARDLGIPIKEIKKLMVGCEESNCDHTREYVEKEIGSYITILDERIDQLTTLKSKLLHLKDHLKIEDSCNENKYCCNVLHQLTTIEKGGEEK